MKKEDGTIHMEKKALTGRLYDVQGFSVQDGPGVRTTAFLKGCPLRCPWCHSPESQAFYKQLSWMSMRCLGVQACKERCIKACPKGALEYGEIRADAASGGSLQLIHVKRDLCGNCGKCAEACYAEALSICGKDYTVEELVKIILRSAKVLEVGIDRNGAFALARRSRGTPRLANRLLKRVRDFAQVKYEGYITEEVANYALDLLDVDKEGLDQTDRGLLQVMIEKFLGGPVGLDTLAAAIGEDAGTIEDVYEPYLLMNGFIQRTPRGRIVTDHAYRHLGISREIIEK